ncbi:hypothetical protein RN001_001634 [Aquatica leii]|uniref:Uncharacterized protein n=1 Tax=Aquatica leii TaxID=1421715 RepID=A0AAN7QMZ8_9COLE|nr:hypothetical protein RN001_001634 [Aquatica leii]
MLLLNSFFVIFILLQVQSFNADNICQEKLNKAKNLMVEILKSPPPASENKAEHEVIMGCLWKNRGLLDESGELIEDNFIHALVKELRQIYPTELAEEKANEALEYCKKARGGTIGETSVELIKCLGIWKNQAFIQGERAEE